MKTIFSTLLLAILFSPAFAATANQQVTMRLASPNSFNDKTTIYFATGATPGFVNGQDTRKLFTNIAGSPSVFSFSAERVMCGNNGYSSLAQSAVVELGLHAEDTGMYVFSSAGISGFDSTSIILFEDRVTNRTIDLRYDFYAVDITDTGFTSGRFFLHVSTPVQFAYVVAGCTNNDGIININQDSTVVWTSASLYDSTGAFMHNFTNVAGQYSFSGLAEGDYTLVLFYNNNYTSTKLLQLGGTYVSVQIQAMAANVGLDEQLTFYSQSFNGTTCFWNFGDGSQITGIANPSFAYMIPGLFTATLYCSNAAGCSDSASVSIAVSNTTAVSNVTANQRNIWAHAQTVTATLTETLTPGAELKIYNMLGQPVYNNPITQSTTTITLNQPDGYYVVTALNNNITSTQTVLIAR